MNIFKKLLKLIISEPRKKLTKKEESQAVQARLFANSNAIDRR